MNPKAPESKVEIIKVASTNPLAFLSLAALLSGALLTGLATVDDESTKQLLIGGFIVIILVMILFVGTFLVTGKSKTGGYPSPGSLLGDAAVKGYFSGGDTSMLAGRWEIEWKERDAQGNLNPYTVTDSATGQRTQYPNDLASVRVKGAMLSVESHDQTTKRVYFLEGRLSTENTITLLYWSVPDAAESMLVGVLILELQRNLDSTVMSGPWMGYDRDKRIATGEVTWTKLTRD